MDKIGFGGGCHWCTEAVFLSLKAVTRVEQGWIAAAEDDQFSEAVIVHFLPDQIELQTLIEIHLHTHSSMSDHSMRHKYRSAVYVFNSEQRNTSIDILDRLSSSFDKSLVTRVLNFNKFRASSEEWQNYFYNNPAKPFCETHIQPKLKILLQQFAVYSNLEKIPIPFVQSK